MWRMYRIFAEICKLRKDHLQLDVQDTCIQIHLNMRQRFLPPKICWACGNHGNIWLYQTRVSWCVGCLSTGRLFHADSFSFWICWTFILILYSCDCQISGYFLLIRVMKGVCLSNIEYRPTLSLDSRTRLKLRELLKFNLEPALFQIHQQSCAAI